MVPAPFFGKPSQQRMLKRTSLNWVWQITLSRKIVRLIICGPKYAVFPPLFSQNQAENICILSSDATRKKAKRAFEILDFSMRIYLAHLLTDWLRQRFPQKKQQGRLRYAQGADWALMGTWNKWEGKSKSSYTEKASSIDTFSSDTNYTGRIALAQLTITFN